MNINFKKIKCDGMDWIHVVQTQHRPAVKIVIKRRVPQKAEVPGPADRLSIVPEGLWSVE